MKDQVGEQRSKITRSMPTTTTSKIFSRTITVTLIRSAIVVGFFLAWEFASGRWIEPFLISSPSRIFTSLFNGFYSGDLLQHTWVTFQEIAIGFPVGAIAGIGLGYSFRPQPITRRDFRTDYHRAQRHPAHRAGAALYRLVRHRTLVESRRGISPYLLPQFF